MEGAGTIHRAIFFEASASSQIPKLPTYLVKYHSKPSSAQTSRDPPRSKMPRQKGQTTPNAADWNRHKNLIRKRYVIDGCSPANLSSELREVGFATTYVENPDNEHGYLYLLCMLIEESQAKAARTSDSQMGAPALTYRPGVEVSRPQAGAARSRGQGFHGYSLRKSLEANYYPEGAKSAPDSFSLSHKQ